MIRGWRGEFVKREKSRKARGYWVLCYQEGFGGLTCVFWAENGKRKTKEKQIPFGNDNKKGNGNGNGNSDGKSKGSSDGDNIVASPVGISGWVKPTSQSRDVGHPLYFMSKVRGYAGRLRNFFAAAVTSTMKSSSRSSWAILNGASVPVGASAWIAGTLAKSCAIRTKTLK
jgi:hypothetical protein